VPETVIAKPYKTPISTLVVIYCVIDSRIDVLLLERADRGYWQSVTGSLDPGETITQTAAREVGEETGIDASVHILRNWQQSCSYEIYPIWRHRYAPGITQNTEHVFSIEVPSRVPVQLAPREHLQSVWLSVDKAASLCFSASNREAILALPARHLGWQTTA
jgi:dihydroneopterin triphosphate diphosphatase